MFPMLGGGRPPTGIGGGGPPGRGGGGPPMGRGGGADMMLSQERNYQVCCGNIDSVSDGGFVFLFLAIRADRILSLSHSTCN